MQINEIKAKLNSNEYNFLKTDKCLGSNIILLTAGGSHAYGTDNENSDLDIRGCAVNSRIGILASGSFRQFTNMDELIGEDFEQFTDDATDTVIYSFNKFMFLLANCNPNTIEMLGCKPEHYFYLSDIGRELIDNSDMFLSKKAVSTFGGYAMQQMYRLRQLTTNKMPRRISRNIFCTYYLQWKKILPENTLHIQMMLLSCILILLCRKASTKRYSWT